ncbi:MAG: S49 family peptidase, partial [Candidatus Zixiibacteriota bacterium]
MIRKVAAILSAFLLLASVTAAQSSAGYYQRNNFLMASPGAFEDGLLGFANPANLAWLKSGEARFFWSSDGVDAGSFGNWGLFMGVPHLGFGVQRQEFGDFHVTDYRFSTAFGDRRKMFGLAYGWSGGNTDVIEREKLVSVGGLVRMCRYSSIGLTGSFAIGSKWSEGIAEIGVRPLGDSRLTLFADGAIERGMKLSDAPWSAGAAVQIIPGINLVGRYFESEAFTIGLTINFGCRGVGAQTHYDSDQDLSYYTYHVRAGALRPSLFPTIIHRDKKYVAMNLKGTVDYQRYVFFDENKVRFMDILNNIRAAVDDERVKAIVLNLSGLRVYTEHAWEIREELKAAQKAGKRVIIFFEGPGMTGYHLASVANKIVMDPEGMIMLPGYLLGRTFFKGSIEKLGLAFDEWRFFKYKSAFEAFSRDKMSEADREQRQAYVDDRYELARAEVCESRGFSHEEFDRLIDEEKLFMADEALEMKLVDTLGRWTDKDKIIENLLGRKLGGISASKLFKNALPQENWGQNPKVVVVYGLGVCAMETGIRARWLEKTFLKLKRDKMVKAVVFRVDSPGGEALASDLVAEALKKCAEEKPVIISQGQVAGSGGYWISMYGDEIIAGPNTVTGSIGVIGGWVYDKGIGDKLGMTSDFVKRGSSADLGFGVRLPFLNITVPARNLNEDEYAEMEKTIKKFYDIFVE